MLFFSASEIIKVAIQIEKNGFVFYRSLTDSIEEENVKKLFDHLADEEDKHVRSFEFLYEAFKDYEPDIQDRDEHYDYISALAGMNVFTQKGATDNIIGKIKDRKGALDMAIRFEKDSIVFFLEIKALVRESQRDAVDELIRQEQEHLKKLFLMSRAQ